MRDFILRKPVIIICMLSLVFAAFIFVMTFRLDYHRQASQYTSTAAVGAEKMNLSLEKDPDHCAVHRLEQSAAVTGYGEHEV